MRPLFVFLAGILTVAQSIAAKVDTIGELQSDDSHIVRYTSPGGVQEICRIFTRIPGGKYKGSDMESENEFCGLDFYSDKAAICPKYWSTSTAGIVSRLSEGAPERNKFEVQYCRNRKAKVPGVKKIAKFKTTMNGSKEETGTASGTSAAYGPAALAYYHLSRYFQTVLIIPPAVYRTMDKAGHLELITGHVFNETYGIPKNTMNNAAWSLMRKALTTGAYAAKAELFIDDGRQVYGNLVKESGERYGFEINTARLSKTVVGQHEEFTRNPPFTALRTNLPIKEAIQHVISTKSYDANIPTVKFPKNTQELQMATWMRELSEMALFDFIFSQQDRVGNIDFNYYWYYWKDGKVESAKDKSEVQRGQMDSVPIPAEIAQYNPVLIQRTSSGDNDAGVKAIYGNMAKKAGWLTTLRHFNPDIYTRLMALKKDMDSKGPVYQYFVNSFNNPAIFRDADIKSMVLNINLAVDILKAKCKAGPSEMRFDLVTADSDFKNGTFELLGHEQRTASCD